MKIDMDIALDPESNMVDLCIHDIPMGGLEAVLFALAEPDWRQNVLDGIGGAKTGRGMGIEETQRSFTILKSYPSGSSATKLPDE